MVGLTGSYLISFGSNLKFVNMDVLDSHIMDTILQLN